MLAGKYCWRRGAFAKEIIQSRSNDKPNVYSRNVAKVDTCFRADSDQEIGDTHINKYVSGRRWKWGQRFPLARNNIIPATWEAEAGELLEPGRWRLQSAEITPLHSSLGDRARLCLKPTSETETIMLTLKIHTHPRNTHPVQFHSHIFQTQANSNYFSGMPT